MPAYKIYLINYKELYLLLIFQNMKYFRIENMTRIIILGFLNLILYILQFIK